MRWGSTCGYFCFGLLYKPLPALAQFRPVRRGKRVSRLLAHGQVLAHSETFNLDQQQTGEFSEVRDESNRPSSLKKGRQPLVGLPGRTWILAPNALTKCNLIIAHYLRLSSGFYHTVKAIFGNFGKNFTDFLSPIERIFNLKLFKIGIDSLVFSGN
jgi:hypothetical protein